MYRDNQKATKNILPSTYDFALLDLHFESLKVFLWLQDYIPHALNK